MTAPTAEQEAEHLHRCLFRRPAPAIIRTRYLGFVRTLGKDAAPAVEQVVRLQLDAEAVATALRFGHRHHPLIQRLHGLYYLCETHTDYWDEFYNDRRRRAAAWLRLLATPVRTAWLLAKGIYLIRRHKLV